MKILKLKLRGAIGIKKGLGLDEVEIDFTQFQPGLIALTGRNGSGKTTIMENMHPYRQMVSRNGSLQSHFFLKDSYRILEFEHNGDVYQSKILIDALTGGSEAYLFKNTHKGFNPLNDGKLTTYDSAIEELLGSPELFFNSVFAGQKSKGIAELKPAERRKLFYELLNLNVYEKYLETAKSELKNYENVLAKIEGEMNALQLGITPIQELEESKQKLEKEIELIAHDINLYESERDKIDSEIKSIEIQVIKNKEILKQDNERRLKLGELSDELMILDDAYKRKLKSYYKDLDDCEIIIENNAKLLKNKDEIEGAINKISRLEKEILELTNAKTQLLERKNELQKQYSSELNSFNTAINELHKKQSNLLRLDDSIKVKRAELNRMVQDSELINDVPCDEITGSGCKFLVNAYASKGKIADLSLQISQLSKEISQEKMDLEAEEANLTSRKQLLIENYEVKLNSIDSSKIDKELNIKKSIINDLNRQNFPQLYEQLQKAKSDIEIYMQKADNIKSLISHEQKSYQNEVGKINAEIKTLKEKIHFNLEEDTIELDSRINMLQIRRQNILHNIETALISKQNIESELIHIKSKIEDSERAQRRIEELRNNFKAIQSEIRDWSFLVKAFDKTGIPVLKLENSGIEITSIANELLSLFENKFRIVFETTKLKADKKSYKESFDINIVEDDGVCEISNKSGGQQVWLETAIQLAISLVVRNQGRNIQTAFLDEKDGALDLDNAYSYIEMLRKAHQMSGVYNTFIITHRPELLDYIPQQVRLYNGYLQILNGGISE